MIVAKVNEINSETTDMVGSLFQPYFGFLFTVLRGIYSHDSETYRPFALHHLINGLLMNKVNNF